MPAAVNAPNESENLSNRTPLDRRHKDDFDTAIVLREHRDFENAKKVLEQVMEENALRGGVHGDALSAMALSKIQMLAAQAELLKPKRARRPRILARAYLLAAKASYLSTNSVSRLRTPLRAHRAWFLSHSLKWRAFEVLATTHMNPLLLGKALRYFRRAEESADGASKLLHFPPSHALYLRYWHAVISYRVHSLRLMDPLRGDDADFRLAHNAWKDAHDVAKEFCRRSGQSSIFPNHFHSFLDVQFAEYVLLAAKAFRDKKWRDCTRWLEKWQAECSRDLCPHGAARISFFA